MPTMQVSMDGLRRNIVRAYNDFVREVDLAGLTDDEKEKLDELCYSIGGLLCVYHEELENFSDLSDLSDALIRPDWE